VEFKNVDVLVAYHGQEMPLLQQDLGETHMVNKEFNERKNGDFYTEVKRLGMIKHIVDAADHSDLHRLEMIKQIVDAVDQSYLHFADQADC
jgi:hypothetical protein